MALQVHLKVVLATIGVFAHHVLNALRFGARHQQPLAIASKKLAKGRAGGVGRDQLRSSGDLVLGNQLGKLSRFCLIRFTFLPLRLNRTSTGGLPALFKKRQFLLGFGNKGLEPNGLSLLPILE